MDINSYHELDELLHKKVVIVVSNELKKIILNDYASKDQLLKAKLYTDMEIKELIFKESKIEILYLIKSILLNELRLDYNFDLINNIYELVFNIDVTKEYHSNRLEMIKTFVSNHLNTINLSSVFNNLEVYTKIDKPYINLHLNKAIKINQQINITSKSGYFYETIYDELANACIKINQLLDAGINYNHIYFKSGYDSKVIANMFMLFGLEYSTSYQKSLLQNETSKDLYQDILSGKINTFKDIEDKYEQLEQSIVNFLNKYSIYSENLSLVKEIMLDDLKRTKINNVELSNVITELKDSTLLSSNDHLIICGLNDGVMPLMSLDKQIINKDEIIELNLLQAYQIAINKKQDLQKLIMNDNVYLSYTLENEHKPLDYIASMDFKQGLKPLYKSGRYDKLEYSIALDNYNKYGIVDNNLSQYTSSFGKYKLNEPFYIDKQDRLFDKLNLSASSLDVFNKCPFKFYLERVLKINKSEMTKSIFIGNYIHLALEKYYSLDINLEQVYDLLNNYYEVEKLLYPECLNNSSFNFYIKKINDFIKDLIEELDYQKEASNFNIIGTEEEFSRRLNDDYNITISGKIDKVLGFSNKRIVIDYKTGNAKLDLKYLNYGLDMQNVIYLNELKKIDDSISFSGTFKQKIKPSLKKIKITDAGKVIKEPSYLEYNLDGYLTNDLTTTKNFILDPEESFVKGFKLNKDGSIRAHKKIIEEDQLNEYVSLVDQQIDKVLVKIINNEYIVQDLRDKTVLKSCEFCQYQDICYKDKSNIVWMVENE